MYCTIQIKVQLKEIAICMKLSHDEHCVNKYVYFEILLI